MAIYIILAAVGVVLGYCMYRGALVPVENAICPDDLEHIFNDNFHAPYYNCPITNTVCRAARCTPAVMQEYYKAKICFLCAYKPPFSLWSFGWQWVLFSAASIVLVGTRAIPIVAIPIVVSFALEKVGKKAFYFPSEFSEKCPSTEDVEQFEVFINKYCLYLNGCTCAAEKMANICKKYYIIASYIGYIAAPIGIYALAKYYKY